MAKCTVLLLLIASQLMMYDRWCDGQDVPLVAGGLQEIKTDDPYLQEALAAVRPQIAFQISGSPSTRFKIVKVLKAHSQIVSGTKYYVKFKMVQSRSTSTNKQKPTTATNTTVKTSSSSKSSKICLAQIHVMHWLDFFDLLSLQCQSTSRKPNTSASSKVTVTTAAPRPAKQKRQFVFRTKFSTL